MTLTISQIDQQIDAITRDLCKREKFNLLDAYGWQRAWDQHPELRAREIALWRQRGTIQQERAEREHAAAMRSAMTSRAMPMKKCPTCGSRTLRAA